MEVLAVRPEVQRAWGLTAASHSGQNSGRFAGEGDAGFLTETEEVAHGDDLVDAGGVAVLIEEGVAGNFNRVGEAQSAMRAALVGNPASHELVAVSDPAGAMKRPFADSLAQAGEGNGNLVGRARGVGADGAVEEGISFILVQFLPVFRRNGRNEFVGIVGRHGGHGKDVAVVGIDDDRRAAADGAQGLFRDVLNAGVNGEVNIRALLGLGDAGFSFDHTLGIALEHARPGCAFKVIIEIKFDLRLPFHVGVVKIEFLDVGQLVEVVGHTDVTEKMRTQGPINVLPDRLGRHLHSRQAEVALGENRHRFVIKILTVVVRDLEIVLIVNLQLVRIVVRRQTEFLQLGNDRFAHDLLDVVDFRLPQHAVHPDAVLQLGHVTVLLAVGAHHVGQIKIHVHAHPVLHQRDAVAVKDLAAHGRDADIDARSAGDLRRVFRPACDLHIPKPEDNAPERQQHDRSQEQNGKG